jgi:hypothetical protein
MPQTHICIDEETLKRDITNIGPDTIECVNRPTVMLPTEPSSATTELLDKIGLSYVAMVCIGMA